MASLVVSRTGHRPKAKNNKEGALLEETRALVAKGETSICPPTPNASGGRVGGDEGEVPAEEEEGGEDALEEPLSPLPSKRMRRGREAFSPE